MLLNKRRYHIDGKENMSEMLLLRKSLIVTSSKSNNRRVKHSIVSHLYDATAKARCYAQLKGGCNRITLPSSAPIVPIVFIVDYCRDLISNSCLHDRVRQLHELLQREAPGNYIFSYTDALIRISRCWRSNSCGNYKLRLIQRNSARQSYVGSTRFCCKLAMRNYNRSR